MKGINGLGRTTRMLVLAAVLALLLPGAAQAASNDSWAVEPGGPDGPGGRPHFQYDLQPGQSLRDVVSISNTTTEAMTFRIYATDALTTPRDAAFALLPEGEAPTGTGRWIRFGISEYEVPARSRIDVPFEITVPPDARPGDHAGGIVAANTETESEIDDDGATVEVRRRVAARVYVRVKGPLQPALRVDNVDIETSQPAIPWVTGRGDAHISFEVRNTGNTRITPGANIKVSGFLGRGVKEFDEVLPELLPGSSVLVNHSWEGLPPADRLNFKIQIESTEVEVTRSIGRWILPWYVLLVLLAAAFAFGGFRLSKRVVAARRAAAARDVKVRVVS